MSDTDARQDGKMRGQGTTRNRMGATSRSSETPLVGMIVVKHLCIAPCPARIASAAI